MLNAYTVSFLFVDAIQRHNFSINVSRLTTENISDTLFVVGLSLNMFCLPFSVIVTWKCSNHTYVVAVHTLNTLSTPYFFVYNR